MKLNNKGVSIIELIISVTLISLVMLFMYRLLSDITFEKDNDTFSFLNQEQRVTVIKRVEKTINDAQGITKITPSSKKITFARGTSNLYQLAFASGKLTMTDLTTSKVLDSWTYSGVTFSNAECRSQDLTNGIIYECTYKIYTSNTNNKDYKKDMKNKSGTTVSPTINNNNIIDDLTFTFVLWK